VLRAKSGAGAVTIHPAEPGDLVAVAKLLERQGLPLDGLEALSTTMVVAKGSGEVVGAAAVELYEDGALLRSVVVSPSVQGQGLGHLLTEAALNIARTHGARTAFLLTTTAARFFPKLGFTEISREDVPVSVQASVEFQSACPASATAMRKRLA
jgi:amino-acid N-acetyltransferase